MAIAQENDTSDMQLNRLTLAFNARHRFLELYFQKYYFHHTLLQMRIGFTAACLFYGLFGIMDAILVPEWSKTFWFIRWVVVCPSILAAFLFSFSRFAYGYLQAAAGLVTMIAGFGIIAMNQLTAGGHGYSYAGGLVQIIFFIFTFSRLRFIWATAVIWTLIAAFIACALFYGVTPRNQIIGSAFHFSLIGLMGMMACYGMEFQTRRNFFLSRQLISKKRRLHIANQFLEQRVSKRTLELKNANQLLREKIDEGQTIQAELRNSRERFQNIFETVPAGMIIVNGENNTIVHINPAAARMIGKSVNHFKGSRLDQLIWPVDGNDGRTMTLPTPHPVECLLSNDQGDPIPILMSAKGTEYDGRPHCIVSFSDIKKIKEAEAAKRDLEIRSTRAQHLQAIGTMAGGIAHDFNNILFGMMGYTELALEDAEEGSVLADNLQEVLRGGHRAKEIIYQILTFSRQESAQKRPTVLTPLIKEALKLLRATIPTIIDIETRFDADVHKVEANPTRIHQVIMNLCSNAAGAIGNRPGRISITLENKHLSPDEAEHQTGVTAGDYVRLVVADDGPGIPVENVDRIFEPFFTTKSQGQGTGMGLSVVLGIVQDHQGVVRVHCEPGNGASFEVLLPASSGNDDPLEYVVPPPAHGSEHILFVDDEKPLGVMLDRMLTRLGYEVTVCDRPVEALALFRNMPQAYDLVITDLTMPQMTGLSLAKHLLKIRPELPMVLCTGYNEQITGNQCRAMGFRDLIYKPVSKKALAAAVRNALTVN